MSGRGNNKRRSKLQPKPAERMNRISEGTNETESPQTASRKSSGSLKSSNSDEVPHIWKEGGSAKENVARRSTNSNNGRSVTFSPELLGKKVSFFSVQQPWVQKTFRGSAPDTPSSPVSSTPRSPVEESIDESMYTTDESLLKRTLDSSACETTVKSAEKTVSTFDGERSPQTTVPEEEEVEEESRDDDDDYVEESTAEQDTEEVSDENVATILKFSKDSLVEASASSSQASVLNHSPPEKRKNVVRNDETISPTKSSPTISPNRRMSLLSGSVYEPPTSLHDVCYNAQSASDIASFHCEIFSSGREASPTTRGKMKEISIASSQRDSKGRTPIHLISQNHAISAVICPTDDEGSVIPGLQPAASAMSEATCSNDKKQVTTFLLDVLLAANPMAMKLEDANGHIPFERALVEFIHIMHNVESPKGRPWGLGSRRFSSYSKLSAPSRIQHMWHSTSNQVSSAMAWAGKSLPFASGSARSLGTAPDNSSPKKTDIEQGGLAYQDGLSHIPEEPDLSDDASWALDHFPSHVQLTSHAKFAIEALSTILDHLDDYIPSHSFRHRTMVDRRSHGSNATRDSFDVAMDEFRDFCFTESADIIAADIVEHIAAIPYLVKTLLLLEDEEEREWVFSTTLFRRVIMHENSIGPWLTGMLQSSKKGVSQQALHYLQFLSDTIEAYPSGWGTQQDGRSSSSNLLRQSSGAHEELHDKVSELEGFIPSLLALEERKIEEAATTLIVRKVLDRMISRPFAVLIVLLDSIFLSLLIISFRAACKIFLTGGTNAALYWIYVANSCTFYFIIRELGKGITILERTRRARTYFLSFWTLTDILSIILALSSTIAMRVQFKQDTIDYENIDPLRGLLATTTGLLWLRVLSLLKSINSQLATFVLAIFQITRDILWFLVILSVLVVSFSQMFYTILVPPECAGTDGEQPDKQVCGSAEYYLKTYTILLGDFGNFERDTFATAFSVVLIVIFTFMVVIVLLNVLIAIVSDSYEKCLIRSQSLFGRARVMLIAELVSFQNLLRTADSSDIDRPESIYSKWWYGTFGDHRWSRGSTVFFVLSGLIVFVWFIAETAGFFTGKRVGNYVASLASILVNVILFIVIVRILSNNAKNQGDNDTRRVLNRNRCCSCIVKWYDDTIQRAMLRLLGSDQDGNSHFLKRNKQTTAPHPEEEWSGRVHYLQREMMRMSEESSALMKENARALENTVSSSELRLRSEVKTVEDNLTDFKAEIMKEMKQSEQRMENMLKESMNQLLLALSSATNDKQD